MHLSFYKQMLKLHCDEQKRLKEKDKEKQHSTIYYPRISQEASFYIWLKCVHHDKLPWLVFKVCHQPVVLKLCYFIKHVSLLSHFTVYKPSLLTYLFLAQKDFHIIINVISFRAKWCVWQNSSKKLVNGLELVKGDIQLK